MMKKIYAGILVVAIISVGGLFAIAQTTGGTESGGKKWGKGGHHRGGKMNRGGGMMFRGLDLTDEQKAQMKQIREASKATVQPLREGAKANKQKLKDATANGAFDEAQISTIATEGAAIHAQLTVQREKVRSQMYALLTAEQKAKAAEMKSKMNERFEQRKMKREAKKAEGGADL